ncbi:MAG: hypothetical protein J6N76_07820, partial [Lachnospiraceae bacterium]|nr:hypothetical protein [Lachnospiraceae bacterium]
MRLLRYRRYVKRAYRILPLLVAAAILCLGVSNSVNAGSVSQNVSAESENSAAGSSNAEALKDAQNKKAELEESLSEAKELVENLQDSKQETEEKVAQLESELNRATAEVASLDGQLDDINEEITVAEDNLTAAEERSKKQYEDMKLRIRYMYENGSTGYLDLLLTSKNFTSFLNAIEYITMISGYDRDKLLEYNETLEEIKRLREELEVSYQTVETMKDAADTQRQTVSVLAAQKDAELSEITADLSEAELQA